MISLALHPIFIFGQFSGYIGFGAREAHPFWSEREKGLFDLFRSTITNILERQDRERAYTENQELYHRMLELSPNAILVDQEQKSIYTNPAGVRLMGFKNSDDIIGKPFEDVISAEIIQDFRNRYRKNRRKKRYSWRNCHLRPNATKKPILNSVHSLWSFKERRVFLL